MVLQVRHSSLAYRHILQGDRDQLCRLLEAAMSPAPWVQTSPSLADQLRPT
jgi:hypothetical protein